MSLTPSDVTTEAAHALAVARLALRRMGTEPMDRPSALYAHYAHELVNAFAALDNAGVFAVVDEATDYPAAEEILAESAIRDTEREAGLDPEEWGDLTRADLARHQGYARRSAAYGDVQTPARTPRDNVAPHEHVYMDGHPEELCLYGSCTLTYREYRAQH